jgi:hypothetical protein
VRRAKKTALSWHVARTCNKRASFRGDDDVGEPLADDLGQPHACSELLLEMRLQRGKAFGEGGASFLDILGSDIAARGQDIAMSCDHVMLGSTQEPKALSYSSVDRSVIVEHADRCRRDPVGAAQWIRTVEQVPQRPPVMRIHPTPTTMFGAVMNHVAPLAECCEPVQRAVAGVMVEMRASQDNRRPAAFQENIFQGAAYAPSLAVAPA